MTYRKMAYTIPAKAFDAVIIFDLDGVVTDTASVQAAAWKRMFDDFLSRHAARQGLPFRPFDADADYRLYVDGKPRAAGVRSFLASRAIELPEGRAGGKIRAGGRYCPNWRRGGSAGQWSRCGRGRPF